MAEARRPLLGSSLLLVAAASLASGQAAAPAHEMQHRHDDPQAYVASLEDPARDAYQKPDEVMKALALRPGEVVADVGAGSGYFTVRFAKAVGEPGRVYAVDVSPDMIRFLNRRVRDAGLRNVVSVLADPDDPLLPDGSVDRFVIVDTWHHVESRAKYVGLMKRMLKPGGQVVHIDFQKRELPIGPPPVDEDRARGPREADGGRRLPAGRRAHLPPVPVLPGVRPALELRSEPGEAVVLLPLLLATIVQGPAIRPGHDLAGYLALASRYGAATAATDRVAALRELLEWRSVELEAALAALKRRPERLREEPGAADEVALQAVEAAVLLHAEVGLWALRTASFADADRHIEVSVDLYGWSRRASGRDVPPHIVPRDYYVALAAASLGFGFPLTARRFADEAVRLAPLDGDVRLLAACVEASLSDVHFLRHEGSDAGRARDLAEKAFQETLALDAASAEARLRLGRLWLDAGRTIEAERLLIAADETGDERQRYLARLFLGRCAERRGRRDEALRAYRRAVEAWPDSQAARLALARLLEVAEGPSAAAEQVDTTLAASRREDRRDDPWWTYRYGPPGFAKASLDRLWNEVIGR